MQESTSRFLKISSASIVLSAGLFILLAFGISADKPHTPPASFVKGAAILITIMALLEPMHILTGKLRFIFGNQPRKLNLGLFLNLTLAVSLLFQAFFRS